MAINITRVYTRAGDNGKTFLVGNVPVNKDCQKLESFGTVDELNSLVGVARSHINSFQSDLAPEFRTEMDAFLRLIQNQLFDVGSILATPEGEFYEGMPRITEEQVTALEKQMDLYQQSLESLKSFALPGGSMANALLHQCRTVCRRAEREILRLSREEEVDPLVRKYVNRLSDLFFVMARYASRKAEAPEYLWEFGLSARKKKGGDDSADDVAPPSAL